MVGKTVADQTAERTLILSPHVDDELLGCFAFLRPGTVVAYGGIEDRPTKAQRELEAKRAAVELGFEFRSLDQPVNSFDSAVLVTPFEELINELEPTTVLIPEPSYNQDHREFFDAGIVATRPHDRLWQVPRVLLFEQPHSVLWPYDGAGLGGAMPSVFVPIDIEAKLAAYEIYESQVRGHRSAETIRALAHLRGAQAGVPHAEAFHARRLLWNLDSVHLDSVQ